MDERVINKDDNYIFLDIDGVLNTVSDWKHSFFINTSCLNLFCQLVKGRDIKIVLISTWKNGFLGKRNPGNTKQIRQLEESFVIYDKIQDGKRYDKITEYIHANGIKKYVIIDDESEHYLTMDKHICIINPNKGFTRKDLKTCKKILCI